MLLWLSSGRASGGGGGRRGWRSGHAVEEEESVRLREEELAPLGIKLSVWGFWRPKLGAGHRAPSWPVRH
jgi:hypothetical protein